MMVDSGRKSLKLCMCGVTDSQRKATVEAHLGRHVLAGRGSRRDASAETRELTGLHEPHHEAMTSIPGNATWCALIWALRER
jgi:hypothetical protein